MASKWHSKLMFPTDSNFVNRVVGADFGPSNSSGNPMVTLHTEVVSPAEVEIDGEQVNIAGVKAQNYYATTIIDPKTKEVDEEKTANARKRFTDQVLTPFGISTEGFNWDNIPVKELFQGKLIYTLMEPEEEEKRKNPTAEQLKKNKKAQGEILKNPITGKSVVDYWPKIKEIFGVAPSDGVEVKF